MTEFDKRYDALVADMKAELKKLLCVDGYNGIQSGADYWDCHVIKQGVCESEDVVAYSYYWYNDMIMASESIVTTEDDIDLAKPERVNIVFNGNDIELYSYQSLSIALHCINQLKL